MSSSAPRDTRPTPRGFLPLVPRPRRSWSKNVPGLEKVKNGRTDREGQKLRGIKMPGTRKEGAVSARRGLRRLEESWFRLRVVPLGHAFSQTRASAIAASNDSVAPP